MNSEERAKRLAAMREEKEKQLRMRAMAKKYLPIAGVGLCVLLIVGAVIICVSKANSKTKNDISVENDTSITYTQNDIVNDDNTYIDETSQTLVSEENAEEKEIETPKIDEKPDSIMAGDIKLKYGYDFSYPESSEYLPEDENKVASEFGILVDLEKGEVIAKKNSLEKMYPASMTKVLTVLVAAEHITNEQLDDTVTVTIEATDYSWKYKCSNAGFLVDETVTVRDLFAGTILPSGGDAAYSLALYIAGSHEAFVDMMNEKVKELGLSKTTHFTNCVGIYDKEHYTTPYDMAVIMKAAVENDLVREITSLHRYTTSITKEHEEGISLSNLFLRRIEDKDTGGDVLCAKTGFVNQSGCCAVSYFVSETNRPYICVTGNAFSSWRAIYDHQYIYKTYTE